MDCRAKIILNKKNEPCLNHLGQSGNTECNYLEQRLSEIINGLNPKYLVIFCQNYSQNEDVNDLIYEIHKMNYQSCIFYNITKYFQFIGTTIKSSVESTSIIFLNPDGFVELLHENNLAHRLSLFVFYWGAKSPPSAKYARFEEPLRVVIITRPREKAFRVFYNQAVPSGVSSLRLVNWYDGESLGLIKTPLLPSTSSVYSKFDGRIFKIPVIHAPPWFFIDYKTNSSQIPHFTYPSEDNKFCANKEPEIVEQSNICVIGGRDHNLLLNLARKMDFKIQYIDPPERTQGSPISPDETDISFNFSGGIGMLQNRSGDIFLGDISLNWERGKAVEFSFFTLADSVAFATHAPRRLNEALAILRPFKLDVWPYLILTIIFSGPIFYCIIKIPYLWQFNKKPKIFNKKSFIPIYPDYINEISYGRRKMKRSTIKEKKRNLPNTNLFGHCIWFTLQLFLKQSCSEPHNCRRVKFLTIVYWIAATYVLADVYSAQLTSQFARPAREPPINTLEKLEYAMKFGGYQLFVEKESSALQLLENGTELFQRLYKLMKGQQDSRGDRTEFLVDSVEKGIEKIVDGSQKVILGGRETLYFNMKRYGSKKFQLSQKLFTRYSAVAVQNGCPYLDSINEVLIHLFEGGVLDKLTDIEYEAMSKLLSKNQSSDQIINDENKNEKNDESSISSEGEKSFNMLDEDDVIQPINLRMLQGAFIVLIIGHISAGN
ncbi:ionotropic receptor 40a [Condylostylus longicornis]|uniref:ionotropic receptor 40a n=1 Tax=Condylostylus longicornis TaxID=2530218 RepID=UPI00244DF086|nr:ionotropic receptor 40a [Condylostylus longicornis]